MRHLLSIPIEEKRDKISQYTNIYYSKPMGFKNQYRKGECSSWERVRDRRRSSILQGKNEIHPIHIHPSRRVHTTYRLYRA